MRNSSEENPKLATYDALDAKPIKHFQLPIAVSVVHVLIPY
jgi:hypothetical protein